MEIIIRIYAYAKMLRNVRRYLKFMNAADLPIEQFEIQRTAENHDLFSNSMTAETIMLLKVGEDKISDIEDNLDRQYENAGASLHHNQLPRLEDSGILEYEGDHIDCRPDDLFAAQADNYARQLGPVREPEDVDRFASETAAIVGQIMGNPMRLEALHQLHLEEEIPREELVQRLSDYEGVETRLHHRDLPMLEDEGVIIEEEGLIEYHAPIYIQQMMENDIETIE